jgi:Ca2+-binding EF-hand superfamily protein
MDIIPIIIAQKCKRESGEQKLVFASLDVNNDGLLSHDELVEALIPFTSSKTEAL